MKILRGELNDFRRDLVERVFIILDRDNDGQVDINDIKQVFNPKRHPEVMQGRRSEEYFKSEFYESLEEHHIYTTGLSTSRQPKLDLDEFMDYYTNVSFCIDSDEIFSIIMNNVWNISGNPLTF
jgi:Ca2+-binding EF-hand superfamily protein